MPSKMFKLFLQGVFVTIFLFACKTTSTIRSLNVTNGIDVTCADGTKVTNFLYCPNGNPTSPPKSTPTSIPFAYRGATGLYSSDSITKAYWGMYDTGLLHALYDHNSSKFGTSTNYKTRGNVTLLGWGVAAISASGDFAGLQTKVLKNDAQAKVATHTGITDSDFEILSNYNPLVHGANVVKYYISQSLLQRDTGNNIICSSGGVWTNNACTLGTKQLIPNAFHSTTVASLISAMPVTAANSYHNNFYTTMGFSNAKIHSNILTDPRTSATSGFVTFSDRFTNSLNVMKEKSSTILYDYYTHFNDNAPIVGSALSNFFTTIQKTGYTTVLPLGIGIKDSSGTVYANKEQKYLNNIHYTASNPTSFASRAMSSMTHFLDRTTHNMAMNSLQKSAPVVAVPVMNYGDFTSNKLNYYLPCTGYNAGALKNIALSVPMSYQSIVYHYSSTDTNGFIQAGMAGYNKDFASGTPLMNPDRQASATLTALIASVQSQSGVTGRDALRQVAYHSTPLYGTEETFTGSSFGTDSQVHGTTTAKSYFRPKMIVGTTANYASILSVAGNVPTESDQANFVTGTTNEDKVASITSHDILIKNGTTIHQLNDIYIGKAVLSNAIGTTQAVAKIIQYTSPVAHDNDEKPAYTGYYYCFAGESDSSCVNPSRRIASNVFGFGMVNYRLMASGIVGMEAIVRNPGSSAVVLSSPSVSSTGVLSSPAFGNSLTRESLSVNVNSKNIAGETWNDIEDGRFRVSYARNARQPFNSLNVSNTYWSNNGFQSYNFNYGFGKLAMNLSSVNTGGKVNKNDALFGSRFEDLQLKQMHAKNMYGVIVDGSSSVDTTNLFYSGHLMGWNVNARTKFIPGIDGDKDYDNNLQFQNGMMSSSIFYNPFIALTSNYGNAKSFDISKKFRNGLQFDIYTIYGSTNISSNIYQNTHIENSSNLSQTLPHVFMRKGESLRQI